MITWVDEALQSLELQTKREEENSRQLIVISVRVIIIILT